MCALGSKTPPFPSKARRRSPCTNLEGRGAVRRGALPGPPGRPDPRALQRHPVAGARVHGLEGNRLNQMQPHVCLCGLGDESQKGGGSGERRGRPPANSIPPWRAPGERGLFSLARGGGLCRRGPPAIQQHTKRKIGRTCGSGGFSSRSLPLPLAPLLSSSHNNNESGYRGVGQSRLDLRPRTATPCAGQKRELKWRQRAAIGVIQDGRRGQWARRPF